MKIAASLSHMPPLQQTITVATNQQEQTISIPAKPNGKGSAVNGGELLMLAIATCTCNDLYREAEARAIQLDAVSVTVNGEFGEAGEPASVINYSIQVSSAHPQEAIDGLISHVDRIAEVHNTLRGGIAVSLVNAPVQ